MNINGQYIKKEAILGYHWYTSTVLFRKYLCIDLVNGDTIHILVYLGTGDEVNDVSKIIEFIES